jgi:hypothetical protein
MRMLLVTTLIPSLKAVLVLAKRKGSILDLSHIIQTLPRKYSLFAVQVTTPASVQMPLRAQASWLKASVLIHAATWRSC